MSWLTAFMSNWYSIAYTVGAVICFLLALWIWRENAFKFKMLSKLAGAQFTKFVIMILLLAFSFAFGMGAYQVTDFVHYFAVKKMAP